MSCPCLVMPCGACRSGSDSCPLVPPGLGLRLMPFGASRSGPQTHALWCLQVWASNSLGHHVGRLQLPSQGLFQGASLDARQLLQQQQLGHIGMGAASGTASPPPWHWPAEGPYTFTRWRTVIERWVNKQKQLHRLATHFLGAAGQEFSVFPARWPLPSTGGWLELFCCSLAASHPAMHV